MERVQLRRDLFHFRVNRRSQTEKVFLFVDPPNCFLKKEGKNEDSILLQTKKTKQTNKQTNKNWFPGPDEELETKEERFLRKKKMRQEKWGCIYGSNRCICSDGSGIACCRRFGAPGRLFVRGCRGWRRNPPRNSQQTTSLQFRRETISQSKPQTSSCIHQP